MDCNHFLVLFWPLGLLLLWINECIKRKVKLIVTAIVVLFSSSFRFKRVFSNNQATVMPRPSSHKQPCHQLPQFLKRYYLHHQRHGLLLQKKSPQVRHLKLPWRAIRGYSSPRKKHRILRIWGVSRTDIRASSVIMATITWMLSKIPLHIPMLQFLREQCSMKVA